MYTWYFLMVRRTTSTKIGGLRSEKSKNKQSGCEFFPQKNWHQLWPVYTLVLLRCIAIVVLKL